MEIKKCPNPNCGVEVETDEDSCHVCGEHYINASFSEIEEGGSTMSTTKKILIGIGAILLLLGAYWLGAHNGNNKSVVNNNDKIVASGTAKTTATITTVHEGLDQPSKSWFLAKAGTLVSGDIAIFDNDNNSKKTPVYDSKESTADVIYLTSDTYIWTEWGCYTIENADAQDVTTLINDKLTNGNFNSVRYFNGFNKLGTNTPTIISSKIDATSITLPTATTSSK